MQATCEGEKVGEVECTVKGKEDNPMLSCDHG